MRNALQEPGLLLGGEGGLLNTNTLITIGEASQI
jgi:hypothetical protein